MRKILNVAAGAILLLLLSVVCLAQDRNSGTKPLDRIERSGTQIRINFDGSITVTLASGKTMNLVPQASAPSPCKDGDFYFVAHDGLYQCVDGTALKLANPLGYTAENSANRRTTFQATPDDMHYASEKLVKDSLDAKQPIDSDLTAIAGLSPSNDDIIQRKAGAWMNRTLAQLKTDLVLVKGDVGLGNVDNTSDAGKPVSTAQQAALSLKEDAANKDTDTALAANSDTRYPSQKAIKAYVDAGLATKQSAGSYLSISSGDQGDKPTCSSGIRGSVYITLSGTGVKDAMEVCLKDDTDTYQWRTIY